MNVLTKQIDVPPSFESYNYGIGLWTDSRQKQSYFYCASNRFLSSRDSAIFRLNITEQLLSDWEFVGKVDFLCKNNTISRCGQYIWSIEIYPDRYTRSRNCRQLILRQIDPKTLKYEVFRTDLEIEDHIRPIRFYYTQHFDVIVFIGEYNQRNGYRETSDMIFSFHVDMARKCIRLKQISLPDIPTVQPYDMAFVASPYKKSSFGLIERDYSLFFYQIDYFGDVFVLEWSESETLEWNQFTVEGDQFESWMALDDRDISSYRQTNDQKAWNYGINVLHNNHRSHLPNGFLYCTRACFDDGGPETHFYHCDFQVETRVCRCKRIFSTRREFNGYFQTVISVKNPFDGTQLFFLSKNDGCMKAIGWEQVVVNQVLKLLHLACLTAYQVIKGREKAMNAEPRVVVSNVNKELPKKNSILSRLMQNFRQPKSKEHNPPKISILGVDKRPRTSMKDKYTSNVCKDEQTNVLPIFVYSQVTELLKNYKR